MSLSSNPAFLAYLVACLILCLNLLFLWGYSGYMRSKVKQTTNEEDAAAFGSALVQAEPPPVARALRAHRNAEASILPFLFLGLVFVLAGGNATLAMVFFAVFTLARLLHSVAYLKGLQPSRTIYFVIGVVAMVGLMASTVWLAIRAA